MIGSIGHPFVLGLIFVALLPEAVQSLNLFLILRCNKKALPKVVDVSAGQVQRFSCWRGISHDKDYSSQ
jgi:hypothetical protein